MAILHRFKWKCRPLSHSDPGHHCLRCIRRFSASSFDPNGGDVHGGGGPPTDGAPDSPPSLFADVKSRLRQQFPVRQPVPSFSNAEYPSFFLSQQPSKIASLEEIRRNLSEFRRRSAPSPPGGSDAGDASKSPALSFKELYKSNVMKKADEHCEATPNAVSLESIRVSLRQIRSSDQARAETRHPSEPSLSLRHFRDSLRMQPGEGPLMRARSAPETLPQSIFGRELGEQAKASETQKTEFIKMYSYGELGEKLTRLRPEVKAKGGNWFSLEELTNRMRRLREMEEKEMQSRSGGLSILDLKDGLLQMKKSSDAGPAKTSMQSLALLGRLGGQVTSAYMLSPPKDELVEKYFHPDNMSSKEKLKLELQKVREEFKMSESDCGSSRVQVALLTAKIKHLSSVLHKKDKHSRKGLQEMVQRRKKLLKYLRRTDWDSYCFVLSKLGLRDNPNLKTYKIK